MDARQAHDTPVVVTDTAIIDMILRHEGNTYTNHPADKGGPTKFGITQHVLSVWRGRPCTADDVRNLTRDEASRIYHTNYVKPFAGLGETVFRANVIDMGVNAGVKRGILLMQQTIGADVDGVIGPQSVQLAVARDWNPIFVGVRMAFYERIIERDSTQIVWRRGWRNRALSFFGRAHRMPMRRVGEPAFGHVGKAYLHE